MKKLLILSLTLISPFALASELNVPNQFEDGQVTSAEQMNANFEAIQAAVNDNHARIESMQQPTKAVFQGFSTDSMNGGQGFIAMQQACHNFLPGSHICNTTEFAESPYNADAAATMGNDSAWVLPNFIGNAGTNYLFDPLSLANSPYEHSKTCYSWSTDSGSHRGITIESAGKINQNSSCNKTNKIACCK
jgi:hypothetical protein